MSIKINGVEINDIKNGIIPITKMYVGNQLIFDNSEEEVEINNIYMYGNTLYNTTESPVIGAYLKGNTLYYDKVNKTYQSTLPTDTTNVELISAKKPTLKLTNRYNLFVVNKEFSNNYYNGGTGVKENNDYIDGYIVDIEPNKTYSLGFTCGLPATRDLVHISFWNNDTFLNGITTNPLTFTTPDQCNKLRFGYDKRILTEAGETYTVNNILLMEGSNLIYDEYYKENVVTINDDIELKGINTIRDSLNLLTGELTKCVSELESLSGDVFTQSSSTTSSLLVVTYHFWNQSGTYTREFMSNHEIAKYGSLRDWWDKLTFKFDLPRDDERFASLSAFKAYLNENPFTYIRQLEEEERTTSNVNLTMSTISTYDDITFVLTSSITDVLPKTEIETQTTNEGDIETLSLELDENLENQNTLEELTNEQNEVVDLTMQGTTEIYEEII